MTFGRMMRTTAFLLIPTIAFNNFAAAKPMNAAVVHSKLEARGVGHNVRITLKDKSEVKGLIITIGEDSCVLIPKEQSQQKTIAYDEVAAIHNTGMSTGTKIGIGVGVAVGVIVAMAVVVMASMRGL